MQILQDLLFQETSNRENFQARYVIHHPATGDLSCGAGQKYLSDLKGRKRKELINLAVLTGWKTTQFNPYYNQNHFNPKVIQKETQQGAVLTPGDEDNDQDKMPPSNNILMVTALMIFILGIIFQEHLKKTFQNLGLRK